MEDAEVLLALRLVLVGRVQRRSIGHFKWSGWAIHKGRWNSTINVENISNNAGKIS